MQKQGKKKYPVTGATGEGVPPQQQQQQPGKLNLRQFDHLTEAISRLQMAQGGHKPPLALPDEEPSSQEAAFVDRTAYTLLPVEGGKHRVRSSLARRHASRDKGASLVQSMGGTGLFGRGCFCSEDLLRVVAGRQTGHPLHPVCCFSVAAAQYDQQVLPCTLAVDDGAAYELAARGKEKGGTRKKDERKKAREDEKLEKRRLKEEASSWRLIHRSSL
ncbi:hypothetical protein HPB48_000957 [Haemaphysalis longicornis]|uniref:Uncharacterized protein n=1 Tax=Haemaphysalis longicornis TaxID=44386 RepID=A0A9J6FXY0_HAELO|nr:hypothetical protein HPB48_000957 [Haemaphysalis longicornis]